MYLTHGKLAHVQKVLTCRPCIFLSPCTVGPTGVLLIVIKDTDVLGIGFFRGKLYPSEDKEVHGLFVRQMLRVKVSWNFLFKHVLLKVWNIIYANKLSGHEIKMVSFKT